MGEGVVLSERLYRVEQVSVAEHGSLGQTCCPRRIAKGGNIFFSSPRDQILKEVRVILSILSSEVLQIIYVHHVRLVIEPQSSGIPINHSLELRNFIVDFQDLINLFLIPGKDKR